MVSAAEKAKMKDFVIRRLESSGLYTVDSEDTSHVLVVEKSPERPRVYVVLHNSRMPLDELQSLQRNNLEGGIFTAHVFYGDGKTFLVKLGRRAGLKAERSLKRYSERERDRTVHLRGLEKEVLSQSSDETLVYFTPMTAIHPYMLKILRMKPVELDYSHIRDTDPRAEITPEAATSIDFKLPEEVDTIAFSPATFRFSDIRSDPAFLIPYKP